MHELLKAHASRSVILLGYFGQSNASIRAKTELTDSQINRILRRAGVTRKLYRDGDGMSAKVVLGQVFHHRPMQPHRYMRSLHRVILKAK